jgi:DNA polymerase
MEACLPWLERQIEIIKPLAILCLGAPSANTIIHRDFRMTQERGQFFESKYARYAIAGLHPAYVLRQHGELFDQMRATLVADIAAARRKVIEARKEPKPTLF